MNNHIGCDFDDFLADQGLAEEVSAAALKRVIAWQLAQTMKLQKVTKKELAERMHTRRNDIGHSRLCGAGIRPAGRSSSGSRASGGTEIRG